MKLVISFVIAGLFCCVLLAPAEAQEGQNLPAIAEGRWALTPLAARFSQVPGAGELYFQKFLGSYTYFSTFHGGIRESQTYGMTDDGMVVFWAALGDKSVVEERARLTELQQQGEKTKGYFEALASSIDRIEKKLIWTLCSFKGGTFKIIATDGVKIRAPDGKERSVNLASSKVVFSKNAAFVRVGSVADVWGYLGWNGERFDTFIQPGESFVAEGRTYTIKKVYDMGRTVDGTPWVLVDLKERSDRRYVCIWSETKTLIPMLASGDPNPIAEGKKIPFRFTEPFGLLTGVLLVVRANTIIGRLLTR